jgi:hypothetical protein
MLAGTSASTGLKTPTVTSMRYVQASYAAGSRTITVELTWDEAVTVAGAPYIAVQNSGSGRGPHNLAYTATGSTANRKRFTLAAVTIVAADELHLGLNNVTLNGGTISDTLVGGTTLAASVQVSHLNGGAAIVKTVTA